MKGFHLNWPTVWSFETELSTLINYDIKYSDQIGTVNKRNKSSGCLMVSISYKEG